MYHLLRYAHRQNTYFDKLSTGYLQKVNSTIGGFATEKLKVLSS